MSRPLSYLEFMWGRAIRGACGCVGCYRRYRDAADPPITEERPRDVGAPGAAT